MITAKMNKLSPRGATSWPGVAGALIAIAATTAGALAQQSIPGKAPATQPAPAAPGPAPVPGVAPAPGGQPVPPPPGPVGVWIDHTGRGVVEIQPCGTTLCGKIVWMQQPNDKQGQPLRDRRNEDRTKRNRVICGLQIIGGLKEMRDGSWDAGWIYDPEQGESFDVELRLRSPDVLQVKGYKGLKFLSETFQWKRVAAVPAPACPLPAPA